MSSDPSVAQRLGRVLERLTRQSGRLTRPADFGSLLLGPADENARRRRIRIQTIITVFMLAINAIGIALALVLVLVAFPEPNAVSDVPLWLPTLVVPTYIGGALAFGAWWIHASTIKELRWAIDGRRPTAADQRNTFLTPWRIAVVHIVLWGAAAVLLLSLIHI